MVVENGTQVIPVLELPHRAPRLPAADLLVQSVKKLLTGGGAGKGGPRKERAAEPPLVAETLGSPVERDPKAIHQVDDSWTPLGHFLDGRLMAKKIAAVYRVVKVLPLGVAELARQVVDAVDAALGTHAMGAADRSEAYQIHLDSQFGQFHRGGQPGQPSSDDHNTAFGHQCVPSSG